MGGGGMGGMGMPAGMDPAMLQALMSDPELMQALSNPKFLAAMQDIMSNPANKAKYENDEEVMSLMNKFMQKMGGMDGGMGGQASTGPQYTPGPTVEEVDD